MQHLLVNSFEKSNLEKIEKTAFLIFISDLYYITTFKISRLALG